jgi:hypothetical protein
MRFETDVRGLRQADGIDHRERTLAVTRQHPLASGVDAHVVGIVIELDAPDLGQILAPEPSPAFATNTLSEKGK